MVFFPTKDMQTPSLNNGPILIEDGQCPETNKKIISLILFTIYGATPDLSSVSPTKIVQSGQIDRKDLQ